MLNLILFFVHAIEKDLKFRALSPATETLHNIKLRETHFYFADAPQKRFCWSDNREKLPRRIYHHFVGRSKELGENKRIGQMLVNYWQINQLCPNHKDQDAHSETSYQWKSLISPERFPFQRKWKSTQKKSCQLMAGSQQKDIFLPSNLGWELSVWAWTQLFSPTFLPRKHLLTDLGALSFLHHPGKTCCPRCNTVLINRKGVGAHCFTGALTQAINS